MVGVVLGYVFEILGGKIYVSCGLKVLDSWNSGFFCFICFVYFRFLY